MEKEQLNENRKKDEIPVQKENFWEARLDELKAGYTRTDRGYTCLVCQKEYLDGEIYPMEGHFYDAHRMMKLHIEKEHGSMLEYLLHMNRDFLGISEIQQTFLELMAKGATDKEIADQMGIALSTCRNHRFKLREKEKQARLFLAVMELMREQQPLVQSEAAQYCDAHKTAKKLDERYDITVGEREKILQTYFDENGGLRECPAREKKKIVVLSAIADQFKKGKKYSEKEVNRLLGRIYEDYPYIRRLLIEYGFMERTKDGTWYWVKE